MLRTLLLTVLPLAALPLAALPLTPAPAAAQFLGADSFLPFSLPAEFGVPAADQRDSSVETFDPVGRAELLVREIPRSWVGSYQAFGGSEVVPASLSLSELRAVGQIVDLRGTMTINGASTAVQGNLNAESDQLDLILLCRCNVGGLEMGGMFSGQQGLALVGWNAPRLTNSGGRLELQPQSQPVSAPGGPAPIAPVRGLW
ncbi:hypothetical protein [Cyanobium sp. LEGE 06143]|uniref:hypothetical protein n=1 Tax=Cyanobium sp. LEGE 06143 TaxID=945727 RepID=UPI00351C8585